MQRTEAYGHCPLGASKPRTALIGTTASPALAKTERVSVGPAGEEPDGFSDYPVVSGCGRRVAFQSSDETRAVRLTSAGRMLLRCE